VTVAGLTQEQLLAEIGELIRTLPSREDVKLTVAGQAWLGRGVAAIERSNNLIAASAARHAASEILTVSLQASVPAYRQLHRSSSPSAGRS
jgi:hypothetical protein